jgi:membrane-associated protease RseP (regulator of RpoE activity)
MINLDELTRIVSRVMAVDDTTLGGPQQHFAFRARGRLLTDSESAYEEIESAVGPMGLLTTLREENGKLVVELFQKPLPPAGRNGLQLALFLLTILSVVFAGASNALPPGSIPCEAPSVTPPTLQAMLASILSVYGLAMANLPAGLPFAFSLLGVLTTHELGHYIAGRWNKTPVSLPFFIPLPLAGTFGTMGAVISMRQPPRDRNRLVEIAVAGPLAGFLVGIPLLLYGLSISTVAPLPTSLGPCEGFSMEGNSILYLLAKLAVFGKLLPAPMQYDTAPLLFWLRSFFAGYPWPLPGVDVMISPIASGAWVGLLITGLNLIPVGQLDGGHLLYALIGEKATKALPWLIGGMVALGIVWNGWFLWALLALAFGRVHAIPLDTVTPLHTRHRWLACIGLVLFLLLFVPIPLQGYYGG